MRKLKGKQEENIENLEITIESLKVLSREIKDYIGKITEENKNMKNYLSNIHHFR